MNLLPVMENIGTCGSCKQVIEFLRMRELIPYYFMVFVDEII